jgi:hypothetical protein
MSKLIHVSKAGPCPICSRDHACAITESGLVICMRTVGDDVPGYVYRGEAKDGMGGMYSPLGGGRPAARNGAAAKPAAGPAPPPRVIPTDWEWLGGWQGIQKHLAGQDHEKQRRRWAEHLRVSAESLRALGALHWPAHEVFVTDCPDWWDVDVDGNCGGHKEYRGEALVFPEKDAAGGVVGALLRTWDGRKFQVEGGRRGMAYPDDWRDRPGGVWCPEGPSDLAALLTMGLTGIARPNNLGGADALADMVRGLPPGRDVIILGERDCGPDGRWPGRDGAAETARRVADGAGRVVRAALPPAGFRPGVGALAGLPPELLPPDTKDAREWLIDQCKIWNFDPENDADVAMGREFAAGCVAIPVYRPRNEEASGAADGSAVSPAGETASADPEWMTAAAAASRPPRPPSLSPAEKRIKVKNGARKFAKEKFPADARREACCGPYRLLFAGDKTDFLKATTRCTCCPGCGSWRCRCDKQHAAGLFYLEVELAPPPPDPSPNGEGSRLIPIGRFTAANREEGRAFEARCRRWRCPKCRAIKRKDRPPPCADCRAQWAKAWGPFGGVTYFCNKPVRGVVPFATLDEAVTAMGWAFDTAPVHDPAGRAKRWRPWGFSKGWQREHNQRCRAEQTRPDGTKRRCGRKLKECKNCGRPYCPHHRPEDGLCPDPKCRKPLPPPRQYYGKITLTAEEEQKVWKDHGLKSVFVKSPEGDNVTLEVQGVDCTKAKDQDDVRRAAEALTAEPAQNVSPLGGKPPNAGAEPAGPPDLSRFDAHAHPEPPDTG